MKKILLIVAALLIALALTQAAKAETFEGELPEELQLVADYGSYEADREILAHLLCGECQGGSRELQEAVGSVVLNRVASDDFPDTIEGVVFQRWQYACTWDGNYDRTPTERNWEVAEYLLQNGSQIPENVVFQAQFKQGKVWKKIDSEIFCYGR